MSVLKKLYAAVSLFILWRIWRFIPYFLTKHTRKKVSKTLLLIRTDAIGDYILFRDFLQILKESEKYQEYKITLLGNAVWRSLSESLDSDVVDSFIWLNRNRFFRDIFYHFKIIYKIRQTAFDTLVYPPFSRETMYGDYLSQVVLANQKIAHQGDMFHYSIHDKTHFNQVYDQLIDSTAGILFEFERNKLFFEKLLKQPVSLSKPYIHLDTTEKKQKQLPYIVFFVGASEAFRRWSVERFVHLADLFHGEHPIYLAGSRHEIPIAKEIYDKVAYNTIHDFCGKTSLVELLYMIKNAKLLISNETVAVHMAAALDTPCVCLSNGNHLGRFNPYPHHISKQVYTIYPEVVAEVLKNKESYQTACERYKRQSEEDINQIQAEQVFEFLQTNHFI